MKVKELKLILNTCNDEDEVIIAKDSEGNHFSPLTSYGKFIYVSNSFSPGDIYQRKISEIYTEEDLYHGDDGVKASVLWPIS